MQGTFNKLSIKFYFYLFSPPFLDYSFNYFRGYSYIIFIFNVLYHYFSFLFPKFYRFLFVLKKRNNFALTVTISPLIFQMRLNLCMIFYFNLPSREKRRQDFEGPMLILEQTCCALPWRKLSVHLTC